MDLASIRERVEALMGFTPAKWDSGHIADDTSPCNCRYVFSSGHMGAICEVCDPDDPEGDNPPREEAANNARLIAAAPDLHADVLTLLDAIAAAEARERAAVEAAACDDREALEAVIDQMAAAMADRLIDRNREGGE